MSDAELTCREVVELVTEYLNGAMSEGARTRFETHLDGCEPCTAHLQQMRSTIEATGRIHEDDLDNGLKDDLLDAFRRWKR